MAVAVAVATVLVADTTPAWAYWTGSGSGVGSASVAILAAPTDVTAAATGDQVEVTWVGATAPGPVALGYIVTRTSTADDTQVDVCGTGPGQLLDATSCDDVAVASGSYTYAVTATFGGWTATSLSTTPVEVGAVETVTTLVLSPATATYGAEDGTAFVVNVDTGDDGTATGTVDVSSGTTDLCTVTLPDTSCSPDPDALEPVGSPYPVIATYGGDATYAGSVSTGQDLSVYAAPVITTTSMAPAVAGETGYLQTLTATGGLPDLAWTVSVGTLPSGLSLDQSTGVVSGTLAAGDSTSTFTVTVFDADGASDSVPVTLYITQALVQEVGTRTASNATSVALTLPLAITAGDALVLSLDQACATSGGTHVDAHVSAVSGDSVTWSRAVATGCSGGRRRRALVRPGGIGRPRRDQGHRHPGGRHRGAVRQCRRVPGPGRPRHLLAGDGGRHRYGRHGRPGHAHAEHLRRTGGVRHVRHPPDPRIPRRTGRTLRPAQHPQSFPGTRRLLHRRNHRPAQPDVHADRGRRPDRRTLVVGGDGLHLHLLRPRTTGAVAVTGSAPTSWTRPRPAPLTHPRHRLDYSV